MLADLYVFVTGETGHGILEIVWAKRNGVNVIRRLKSGPEKNDPPGPDKDFVLFP